MSQNSLSTGTYVDKTAVTVPTDILIGPKNTMASTQKDKCTGRYCRL